MDNTELTTNEALLLIGALYVESVKLQKENMNLKDELHMRDEYAQTEIENLRSLLEAQQNQKSDPEPKDYYGVAEEHAAADTQADGYAGGFAEPEPGCCGGNCARTETGAIPLPESTLLDEVIQKFQTALGPFARAFVIDEAGHVSELL